jgi:hypothetical protein
MVMKLDDYRYHCSSYDGYCESCGEINEGGHEPDAMNYHCYNCDKSKSMGIETAFLMGLITIEE